MEHTPSILGRLQSMTTIVEITRAIPGTGATVVSRFLAEWSVRPQDVLIICLDRQVGELSKAFPEAEIRTIGVHISKAGVVSATEDEVVKRDIKSFLLASFYPSVLRVGQDQNFRHRDIQTVHLGRYSDRNYGEPTDETLNNWNVASIAKPDAARLLAAALAKRGRRAAMRRSTLRRAIGDLEPRLGPGSLDTASTPRLIAQIVGEAERGRLITVDRGDRQFVTLTDLGYEIGTSILAQLTVSNPTIQGPTGPPAARRRYRGKSAEIVDFLRSHEFGPFQETRLAVYDEIDRIIGSGVVVTVSNIVRFAVDEVRSRLESDLAERHQKPYPWKRLMTFVEHLMRQKPVLLSLNSDLLSPSFRHADEVVGSLVKGWRMGLDGQIIITLIRGGIELGFSDRVDIAGALYNSRSDDAQEKVLSLLRLLIESGIVEESSDSARLLQLVDGNA